MAERLLYESHVWRMVVGWTKLAIVCACVSRVKFVVGKLIMLAFFLRLRRLPHKFSIHEDCSGCCRLFGGPTLGEI